MPLQDACLALGGVSSQGGGRGAPDAHSLGCKAVDFTAFCPPGINTWLMPINCEDPELRMASTPDTVYEVSK